MEKGELEEKELYIMMYSLQSLHNKGISVKETVMKAIRYLLIWYRQTEDMRYLHMARIHMQAYVNFGYALDQKDGAIRQMLELSGDSADDFRPGRLFFGKQIKLTKSQVRGMIGKWRATEENPMTISQVVDDIMEKVSKHQEGHYIYEYQRKVHGGVCPPDIYELVVSDEICYFYDVKNFKFYSLSQTDERK